MRWRTSALIGGVPLVFASGVYLWAEHYGQHMDAPARRAAGEVVLSLGLLLSGIGLVGALYWLLIGFLFGALGVPVVFLWWHRRW